MGEPRELRLTEPDPAEIQLSPTCICRYIWLNLPVLAKILPGDFKIQGVGN